MDLQLRGNYRLEMVEDLDAFYTFTYTHRPQIFEQNIVLDLDALLSESEKAKRFELKKNMGTPYKMNYFISHNEKKVGWFMGYQTDSETFYMMNTALFPEHQNKGVYSSFLLKILEHLQALGFQKVYSRHLASNNQIIIPKLKAGFMITNFEISEMFGTLIHLTYFFNEKRKQAIQFRMGSMHPNNELSKSFSLKIGN